MEWRAMPIMKTNIRSRVASIASRGVAAALLVLVVGSTGALAGDEWPPAPPLERLTPAEVAAPLPKSIDAFAAEVGAWRCIFHYTPEEKAQEVHLVGSFNGWDRLATPMQDDDGDGTWTVEVELPTGIHEYKFIADSTRWTNDPLNDDRIPDSYGGFNSFMRLGRLAQLTQSRAEVGDGRIDVLGLEHQPPQALYMQVLPSDELSVRYRTLAHDVAEVALAVRDGATHPMTLIINGPVFAYWETRIPVPPTRPDSNIHTLGYTFVLDDGAGARCDPHVMYSHSFTGNGTQFVVPEWTQHAVWYQVLLDRFHDGDPANDPEKVRPWTSAWFEPSPWEGQDGQTFYEFYAFDRFYGGDIVGLEAKLPYLKDLGVNALYLNPVFKAPSYHKYDVQNYVHIDDGFAARGDYAAVSAQENLLDESTWKWTESDRRFLAFLDKAHEMGFKVILDAVFNHVGVDHPAFVDVKLNGQNSVFADWFEVTQWEPLEYKGWQDFEHMPVFKKDRYGFSSIALKKHLLAVTKRWMDPNGDGDPSDGVDGWRLDVPHDIPKPFWAAWRNYVKRINPDAYITGEVWHRAEQWLDGRHFDGVMNYEFARTAVRWVFDRDQKIPASVADARLAELRLAYPQIANYSLQNLVNSHDTDRLASMAMNPDRAYDRQNRVQDNNPDYDNSKPDAESYARARLVALLQMTYVGAPLVYYGDEAGMWGADDPSNRKPMLWKELEPYAKPEDNHVMGDQLAYYREVIALRNAHSALRVGEFQTLLTDDEQDIWAYLRTDADEHVLVVLNASDAPGAVDIPLPVGAPAEWSLVFGQEGTASAEDGALHVEVPAIAGVVLQAPR
jgi:cyclomaltodextrinase